MSFFCDRVVNVTRPSEAFPTTGMASQSYATVYSGIACSIQMKRERKSGIDQDNTPAVHWLVMIDPTFAGSLQQNDTLADDLGKTYRVAAAYSTPLGWELLAGDLEAVTK